MANDTTTTINAPTVGGGDKLDESFVKQSDGVTQAKRPRVVVGADDGTLYDDAHPIPVGDRYQRQLAERSQLLSLSKLDVTLNMRHRERVRWGDRLDIIDRRGPGGR